MRYMRGVGEREGHRSNRVVIYVVDDEREVQRLCGRCPNVAGFYVPRAGGSIAFTPMQGETYNGKRFHFVLFHEYTHHFLLENFPGAYARWFNEGFAEFHSTFTSDRDGSLTFGNAAQHRAYGLLAASPIPIETLLDPDGKRLNAAQMDIFYGRAWLLTHMLTFDETRKGQLPSYLRSIADGKPSLEAAREPFGDLKTLQRDMDRYLRKPRMSGFRIPAERIDPGAITIRPLTRGEAETMAVRMKSDRGVNPAQATALVPEARRRAAKFPDDAGAQAVLAEAEYDAGNLVEAEAAADRALAVDPKLRDALLYKGRAQIARARESGADAKGWQTARSWFVRANRNDPDAAEPLVLFYQSFLAQGIPPTKSAALGLERAFIVSPHDVSVRQQLVRQLIIDARIKEARSVLLPMANNPHAAVDDNPAARLVKLIDADAKTETLLAAMDGEARAEPAPPPGGASPD